MSLLPVQIPVEFIPDEQLVRGGLLARGSEGVVYRASYLETPVAVKLSVSKAEVDMTVHSGTPCHVTQQIGACATMHVIAISTALNEVFIITSQAGLPSVKLACHQ